MTEDKKYPYKIHLHYYYRRDQCRHIKVIKNILTTFMPACFFQASDWEFEDLQEQNAYFSLYKFLFIKNAFNHQVWPSLTGHTRQNRAQAPVRSSCGTSSWSCCRRKSSAMSSPGSRGSMASLSSRTLMKWPGCGAGGNVNPR